MTILSVTTLCPSRDIAEEIAEALLTHRLAACTNIHGPVHSQFSWLGRQETAEEVPLIVKTRPDLCDRVVAAIRKRHPYDVPAIFWHEEEAPNDYTHWVREETR